MTKYNEYTTINCKRKVLFRDRMNLQNKLVDETINDVL